jgi:hypothetical protein
MAECCCREKVIFESAYSYRRIHTEITRQSTLMKIHSFEVVDKFSKQRHVLVGFYPVSQREAQGIQFLEPDRPFPK